jgi:2',3'-cyclic-nucleotide 2'-phosphodiesterase (5'-nucleotidase family)
VQAIGEGKASRREWHMRNHDRRGALAIALVAALTAGVMIAPSAAPVERRHRALEDRQGNAAKIAFKLTVLHNNDGESQVIDAGSGLEDFGGLARFATQAKAQKQLATDGKKDGVLMVSSGDNFLPGPEFNASLDKGPPYYDAIGLNHIGYDAIAIGNHDFDFGPEVLADFIDSFDKPVPFLSANLDVSGEPELQALKEEGRIKKSVVVKEKKQKIGIIGATTPLLEHISSPRNVEADADVAGAIQKQVTKLQKKGVNKIVLISHLQSIDEDLALAEDLSGIDVMVAGGGDELLANEDDLLVPGDGTEENPIFGPYPMTATDKKGKEIPVVTTKGTYTYLGKLVAKFNAKGKVVGIGADSGPVRIAGGSEPDAVDPNAFVQENVVDPVIAAIAALAANVIGTSEVDLDGRRSQVRTAETNEGNLIADSLLWQADQLAASFGVPAPDVALQNGGGIRNDSVIPAGELTELDTFDMVPFANFVSIVPNVSRETFKEILENAVSRVEAVDGRFPQIAGFTFTYDAAEQARTLDETGAVVTPGSRVRTVALADGTPIVTDGAVVPGAALNVATIDFLARGGDQYPFGDVDFTTLGVVYQKALENYITDELAGTVTAADYPEGGEGRTTRLN